jgi:long-chain acyl-CoA synthetase
MRIDRYLEDSAGRHPDKVALVCGARRARYADIEGDANALAHALLGLGLERQERVALYADNSVEAVTAIFATLKAAGVFVVLNPQVKARKLAFIAADCDVRVLFTSLRALASVAAEVGACPGLEHIVLHDWDGATALTGGLEALGAAGKALHALAALLDGHRRHLPVNPTIDLDLASLIYTSGSTGLPKGVMLTHGNMDAAAASIIEYLRSQPDDVILSPLPLSFDYGLYQVLMAFRAGASVVLEKQFVYPQRYLDLLSAERVTALPLVPTLSAILVGHAGLEHHDLSSVRYITNTAQAFPEAHIRHWRRVVPQARIYSMYGLTECKRVAYLPPELIDRKPTSVGIAIPGTEAWIEDEAGRRVTTPGETGELVVRGPHVMPGYWNRPEETRRCLRPGRYPYERELKTGDLFRQDADGHLYFVARADELIKTAGERVGPREVENALHELAAVKGAAVIGVPDALLGSAIKAFVSVREGMSLTQTEVLAHCARRLEKFMVPKHVAFVDELPTTPSGKLSKRGLA